MVEIKGELEGILGKKPITQDEFVNAKNSKVLGLPGQWETMGAVVGSLAEIVQYGLPDDYYQKYPALVQKLTIDDLAKAAEKTVHPEGSSGSSSATGPRSNPRSRSSASRRSPHRRRRQSDKIGGHETRFLISLDSDRGAGRPPPFSYLSGTRARRMGSTQRSLSMS